MEMEINKYLGNQFSHDAFGSQLNDYRHMKITKQDISNRYASMIDSNEQDVGNDEPAHILNDFAQMTKKALTNVEDLDKHSDSIIRQSVINPDSVETHEVIIAAQKARLALNLTKTVVEGFVRSYRELTSLR